MRYVSARREQWLHVNDQEEGVFRTSRSAVRALLPPGDFAKDFVGARDKMVECDQGCVEKHKARRKKLMPKLNVTLLAPSGPAPPPSRSRR